MAGVSLRWTAQDPATMARAIEFAEIKLARSVDQQMSSLAGEGRAWMQANAPWNDRTGNARRGLTGEYSSEGTTYRVTFAHTVKYGKFLEKGTRFMRRFMVIDPAMRVHAPKARAIMRRAVQEALS